MEDLGINFQALAELEHRSGVDPDKLTPDEFVQLRVNQVLYGQLREVEERLGTAPERGVRHLRRLPVAIPPRRLQAIPWARFCVACQKHATPFPVAEVAGVGKEY